MNKIKDSIKYILAKTTTINIIKTRIKEESVGHGKDAHLLLVALIVM